MATRSMPFWPRPATTSGSSWPGSGLCAPFSGRLSWSGITRAAPLPHPPEHANSLFHRRLAADIAVLVPQALIDPLGRVALLGRRGAVRLQNAIDDGGERIELGAGR